MIARLQQAITLSLIAFAAFWAVAFASRGAYGWATFGAVLIVFGYAAFMGFEFVLLTRFGPQGADAPTGAQLLRAWFGEVLRAPLAFCWRQPFRSEDIPDSVHATRDGCRGVILVHGFVCNRGFWNPWLKRFRASGIPFVAVNLEPPFGSIDAYAGVIEAGVQKLHAATGLSPVIVAHSMGGLATRAWHVRHGGGNRVHRIVTIASPHHGTWLGRFAITTNGEQMQIGSPWLDALVRAEGTSDYARFTCFFGHCDNIVFPMRTAMLPGADNRHLAATAHICMAFRTEVVDEVLRWVTPSPGNVAGDSKAPGRPLAANDQGGR